MGYFVGQEALDAHLNDLKNNTTRVVLTVGVPTNFADANANYGVGSGQKVVEATVAPADFTLATGPTDGRQVTVAAKSGLTPVVNGTADHVCWLDTINSAIKHYAPLASPLAVTTSGTVTIPAHSHINRAASAVA